MKYSRRTRTRSRKYSGGGDPSGAWPWVTNAYGSTPTEQVMNTFGSPNNTGNMAVALPNSYAVNPYPGFSGNPVTAVGGRRRRRRMAGGRRRRKSMKGGFWGAGESLVPLSLLTLQQYFGPKKKSKKRRC
jgi:hypothetical protein